MAKFKLAYVIESIFKQATLFTICLKWTVGLCPSLFAHELMTLLLSKELNQFWECPWNRKKSHIQKKQQPVFSDPFQWSLFLPPLLFQTHSFKFIHPVNFLKGFSCPPKFLSSCTRSNMPPSRKHECFFIPKHNFFFCYFNTESNKPIRFGL